MILGLNLAGEEFVGQFIEADFSYYRREVFIVAVLEYLHVRRRKAVLELLVKCWSEVANKCRFKEAHSFLLVGAEKLIQSGFNPFSALSFVFGLRVKHSDHPCRRYHF